MRFAYEFYRRCGYALRWFHRDRYGYIVNAISREPSRKAAVMRFVCDERDHGYGEGKKRETRSSFKLASGVSTTRKRRGRIWNACSVRSHTGGREKRGKEERVRQIREEYTRRSQSFAVRLRETTVYSRVKSHTRSWISAKCLYYRNIAPVSHAGCHMVNFSQIVIAKMARTDRIDGLYFVIPSLRKRKRTDATAPRNLLWWNTRNAVRWDIYIYI